MISDEARKWAEAHGVVFGEDGLPVPVVIPGPPQPCLRCGGLAEYGAESILSIRGKADRRCGVRGLPGAVLREQQGVLGRVPGYLSEIERG
jgi:hypothetical protein